MGRQSLEVVSRVQSRLQHRFPQVKVFSFQEIASTSVFLKDYAKKELNLAFCITKKQTSGYGQQLRAWQSGDASLTFSLLLHFKQPLHRLNGLTQVIVLKVIEGLSEFSDESFKVKWPNDLYVNGKKAGGILVESVSYTEHDCWLVIGIGLNNGLDILIKDSHTDFQSKIGSVGLSGLKTQPFLEILIARLLMLSKEFTEDLFKEYSLDYRLVDFFELEQPVFVYDNALKQPGLYKGLTHNGELLVEMDGVLRNFRSGNTSIRPI